jgi:hypothetical protein
MCAKLASLRSLGGVVADGDQKGGRDLGTDALEFQKLRCSAFDQGGDLGVDVGDFFGEGLAAAGEAAQVPLDRAFQAAVGAGPEAGASVDQVALRGVAELIA